MARLPDGRADAAGRGRAGVRACSTCSGGVRPAGAAAGRLGRQRRRRAVRRRAARPARRARSRRGCSSGHAHAGRAGGAARGRWPGRRPAARRVDPRPDVVVDGIVGIGGRPGLRAEAAVAALARSPACPVVAVDVPVGRRRRHRRARRPARRGRRDGHVRHPQGRAPRRPGRRGVRRGPPGRHRARPARRRPVEALQRRRRRRAAAAARRRTRTSTPAAWSASAPARRSTPAPACSASPAPASGLVGMVRYVGDAPSPTWSAPPTPRWSSARPGAGLGGRLRRRRRRRRRRWPRRSADGVPVVVDADALAHVDGPLDRPGACSPRTPASWPRCSASSAPRSRPRQLAARARGGRRGTTRVVLLKGRHTLVADPDGRVRVTTTGTPWLATAGAGDVLGRADRRAARRRPRRRTTPRRSAPGCTAPPRPLRRRRRPARRRRRRVARRRPGGWCATLLRAGDGTIGRHEPPPAPRAEIVVDLDAIRHNVRHPARAGAAPAQMMTVVKADGYGHGMVESARAAREAGADWLGVATLDEALALRAAGDTGRLLCWLARARARTTPPRSPPASTSRRTPSPSSRRSSPRAASGRPAGPAAAQGRHRPRPAAGRPPADWPDARRAAAARRGRRRWSGHRHLVALRLQRRARPPGQRRPGGAPSARRSTSPSAAGLRPEVRHLANSAAAILRALGPLRPGPLRHRVVRPRPGARRAPPDLGLRPAMTVARAARAGQGDRRRARASPTATPGSPTGTRRVGLVPVGYGDGVPRHAGNRAEVAGRRQAAAGPRPGLHGPVRRRPRRRPAGRRRRGRAVRARRRRRAHRAGLGRGVRHHQLRDRHPDRRPDGPPLRRTETARTEHRRMSVTPSRPLGVAAGAVGWPRRRRRRRRRPPPPGHRAPRRGRRRRRSARCAPTPITVVADDGVTLHVEVDELDRRTGQRRRRAAGRRPTLTVVFVHGYALNLDCWHFQRAALPRPGPHGLLRPALPRPLRPLRRGHATIDQLGRDLPQRHRRRRARGPGGAGRPLDGRHDDHRAGRAAPRAVRRPGRRRRPDLDHRRRAGPAPDPAARCCRSTVGGRLVRAWSPRWPAGTGSSTACAGSGRAVAMVATDALAFGDDVPAALRRVRRLDALGDAVRGGRGVLPELRRPRQVRRPSNALGERADRDHLRHRGQAHLDRPQPQAARAHRRLHAARVRGRRAHGDPGAARPGQRRARPADRRGRASRVDEPGDASRYAGWAPRRPPARRGRARRPSRPARPRPAGRRAGARRRRRSPTALGAARRPAGAASTGRPVGALVLDPSRQHDVPAPVRRAARARSGTAWPRPC